MRAACGLYVLAVVLMITPACSCDDDDGDDGPLPCEQDDSPEGCGEVCSPSNPCPGGLYCGEDQMCTADCELGSSTDQCEPDERCTVDGRCVPRPDGSTTDARVCADVMLRAERTTPRVILIVDQSGSMTAEFDESTRWLALRDSLLAQPDGFVFDLESQVEFGLAMYSSRHRVVDDEQQPGMAASPCPLITGVAPAIDNFDAIEDVYGDADPIDNTPTGDSVEAVLTQVLADPDPEGDPTIFVLATDGEPDRCEQVDQQLEGDEPRDESVNAVAHAFDEGIRTYVIWVGALNSDDIEEHIQDVANAGIGVEEDAEFWVGDDNDSLRSALRQVIGGQLSCNVQLNGRIRVDQACSGAVELNGRALQCDDDNGWRAVDETHLEILGTACEELQDNADAELNAVFPCDAVILI